MTHEEIIRAIEQLEEASETLQRVFMHIEGKRRKIMRTEQEMFVIPNARMGIQEAIRRLKELEGLP